MGEHLIKPYEISVWEDKLIQDGNEKKFIENKIAIIGSNTMTGLNKVSNPVFNKKSNGEKTLTFSLRYRYFDPYSENEEVINPFASLLINERKVKLFYDDEWYEFIVKDHTESSDGYEWTYTCVDAFVLELSKIGYNITFDTELNNNQGTALELAKETVKNTDWRVKSANTGKQLVAEPIYKAVLENTSGIEIINTNEKSNEVLPTTPVSIYLFYSYVKNQDGKFVQFIIRDENRKYTIDDKNVITDTNFRIITDLVFKNDHFETKDGVTIITLGEIETKYQANRLVYKQRTTYDPVMGRTVDRFKAGDREIYRYIDSIYSTSDVLVSYVTNGENFNILEDGSLQGWNPYVGNYEQSEGSTIKKLELVTRPELSVKASLASLGDLAEIEGYLKVQFNGSLTEDYKNAIYNSGFENNSSLIESVASGQEFVLRWRAKKDDINSMTPARGLRVLVAKYRQDDPTPYRYYFKHIDPDNIIMQFEGEPQVLNNIIDGGYIDWSTNTYYIDNVAQTVSTKYIYKDSQNNNKQYVWSGANKKFVELDEENYSNYLPYYYLTTKAKKTVPNSIISDPSQKYGIFFYNIEGEVTYFIQDVQLTRFIADGANEDKPILIGNVPTATSKMSEYYYLKPANNSIKEDVKTYATLDALKEELNIQDNIVPIYNENSEKVLSISAAQSNCFDILQTIAETFECWVELEVNHDEKGKILYDEDGLLEKYINLKEYIGHENWAGFKYGINLESIERNINSEEFVTKLIVDSSQSEYVDEGLISIANANSNPSGESYILNFDYYYNQGLLNRIDTEQEKINFINELSSINTQLKTLEKDRLNYENSFTKLSSERTTYTEMVETAKENQTLGLEDFQSLTGLGYGDYQSKQAQAITYDNKYFIKTADESIIEGKEYYTYEDNVFNLVDDPVQEELSTYYEILLDFLEEDNLVDILGEIYVNSVTINNYSGIVTNVEKEYQAIKTVLYGLDDYSIKVWVDRDNLNDRHIYVELNDYLPGFTFEINGSTYTSTVSKKFFDIRTDATEVNFVGIDGYKFVVDGVEQQSFIYNVNDNVTARFKLKSNITVEGIVDKIDDLIEQKAQLIKEFESKYSRFIQEGTWNSTDYIDADLYYLDALQVSNTSAQPVVSYTINVVEVSQLEGLNDYSFDAGDKTYIEDTEFFGWAEKNGVLTPAREEVIVSEVEWHLDEPDQNTITVQNYKTRFEDLFQRISATVQTVQYNEATYAKISTLLDANGTINQNVLLESLNNISGREYNLTSNGSIVIKDDVILVQNLTNPANHVIISSEGIRVSSDGGENYTTVIDGQGINIGAVYTGTLNTNEVVIGNKENPSFRWDKSGISAYKSKEDNTYDLQTYVRYDQYGLYGIKDGETFKAQNLQEVLDKAHFAVTWDGFFIKNSYEGGGQVEITTDNDFRVLKSGGIEKIKIGALEWNDANGNTTIDPTQGVGAPTLYGIRIKNDAGAEVMKTDDEGNITITGTINANAGEIGGLVVNDDKLTMDTIVLEPGVGIYSTEQIDNQPAFIISDVNGSATFRNINALGGILGQLTVQDTITVGDATHNGTIQSYGYITGNNGWTIKSDGTAEFQNAIVRGEVNAGSGDFYGIVTIGKDDSDITKPYIVIDGQNSLIKSSNYQDGAGRGWMINKDGDATFNNITARGAIRTAVFEYAEIQAVGGVFIFRPSSTIRSAAINGNNLVLTVEKPQLFKNGQWCKVSNYTADGEAENPDVTSILLNNGLTHVYQVSRIQGSNNITLLGAAAMVGNNGVVDNVTDLIGGALVDMGNKEEDPVTHKIGTSNYGIGINSSDNTVNLPARAISLFETTIDETKEPKVTYNYRGILGTLPQMNTGVDTSIYQNMQGTQGIYTDNMYIGDEGQFIAFYEDEQGHKQLRIKANQVVYEVTDEHGQGTGVYHDVNQIEAEGVPGADGKDAIQVIIDSSAGNMFFNKDINATLTCTVLKGGTEDITSQVTKFTWKKKDKDGNIDSSWSRLAAGRTITIGPADIASKAIFICEVEF